MVLDKDKVKKIIRTNGYTQKEVAEELQVSQSTVSDWLNGTTHPNKQNIDALAKYLSVPAEEIMSEYQGASLGNNNVSPTITQFDFRDSTINFYGWKPLSDNDSISNTDQQTSSVELDPQIIAKIKAQGGDVLKLVNDLLKKHFGI